MDTLVNEYERGEYTIEIHRDDSHNESPREWENLGTMVCWHSKYQLGDEQGFDNDNANWRNFIVLPLYLYDHSGITINTTGFSCQWDSGQVGYIYVSIKHVKKEYNWKRLTKKRREQIEQYLKNEVEVYDDYLTGNVYGYIIKDKDDEQIDSCWGYYGDYDQYCLLEAELAVALIKKSNG